MSYFFVAFTSNITRGLGVEITKITCREDFRIISPSSVCLERAATGEKKNRKHERVTCLTYIRQPLVRVDVCDATLPSGLCIPSVSSYFTRSRNPKAVLFTFHTPACILNDSFLSEIPYRTEATTMISSYVLFSGRADSILSRERSRKPSKNFVPIEIPRRRGLNPFKYI